MTDLVLMSAACGLLIGILLMIASGIAYWCGWRPYIWIK